MTDQQTTTETVGAPVDALPKLTPKEFKQYNRIAEHMDYFHNHFRQNWNLMYKACEASRRPSGMSIRQFLTVGLEFCRMLTMHHGIEEAHVFPLLARKMPAFEAELHLPSQHRLIHAGLVRFEEYLTACSAGDEEFRMPEMKARMDAFGTVLWQHLSDEVKELGAENMRKYWTLDEMKRFPF